MTRCHASEYLTTDHIPLPEYLGGEVVVTIASRPKWNGAKWIYEFVPVESDLVTHRRVA